MTHLAGPDLGQAVMGSRRHQTPWPRDAQGGVGSEGPRAEKEWGQEERRGGNGTAGREGPRLKGKPSSTSHGRASRRDASTPAALWASAPRGPLSPWPEPQVPRLLEKAGLYTVSPHLFGFLQIRKLKAREGRQGSSQGQAVSRGQRHTGGKPGPDSMETTGVPNSKACANKLHSVRWKDEGAGEDASWDRVQRTVGTPSVDTPVGHPQEGTHATTDKYDAE